MMLPSKRPAHDETNERFESLVPEPKRRATLKNGARNIMGIGGLSFNGLVLNLEPMLRSCVREEVERAILSSFNPSTRSSLNQIEASRGRSYQLRFVNKLLSTIFTGSKVEAEDGDTIRIVLVDAATETIVSSGSLSSIKVEIVVLNGEFGVDERRDWTEKEFNASVLRERQGKRPLVTGELSITLVDGVGIVDNVIFTDNSSWIRCRKFRLGARVVQRVESIVREATSDAFMVKDHRGELYKKHHPPFLHDQVWRLERIAKDGAFHKRLTSNCIFSVKDFLRLHVVDPSALRHILGGGISNRVWDTIIDHALSCVLVNDDDEWYSYYGTAQTVGLLLNSIYRVEAATFDGQIYQPVEKLTFSQKLLVDDAKRQAYRNVRDLVLVDRRAIIGPSMPLTDLLPEPLSIQNLFLQQPDFPVGNQFTSMYADEPYTSHGDFNNSSTSYAYGMEDTSPSQVSLPHGELAMQAFNSLSFLQDDHFATEDNSQAQIPIWTSTTPAWGQASGSNISTSASESSVVGITHSSPNEQGNGESRDVWPKARWLKLRAVVQWRSISRGSARRRPWLPLGICI